jgi:Na+/proline symporter
VVTPLLAGIAAYIVLQFAIGTWVARRIRSEDDYLIAGRSLGPGLTAFTVFATWFGAETCVSAAGLAYAGGLMGASAEPFGYGICIIVLGLFYAVPLWRMRLSTPADFYRIRYSPAVERLAVILLVPTSVIWAAAQIRAFGQVLSAASGFEVETMIALAAAVVIAYTAVGGLLAVAWTDLVQGVVLVVGLIILAIAVLVAVGPETVLAIEPERLRLFGGGQRSLFQTLEVWSIPILYVIFAGALVSAILSTVDSALLVAGSLTSHNLIVPLLSGAAERTKLWLARSAVAVFGLLAWYLAVRAETVFGLVETASSFGSAGIVTVLTLGLFTRIGGTASAIAALTGGLAAWVVAAYVAEVPYPFLTSLAVAVASYLAVATIGSRPGPRPAGLEN